MSDGRTSFWLALCLLLAGCGGEPPRVAQAGVTPGASGASPAPCPAPVAVVEAPQNLGVPALPAVRLDKEPIQFDDDTYTVWGASYYFRSRQHRDEVTREPIRISGYVTKTNLPDAPACAVHRGGKADAENCKAAIPTFWLGDSVDSPESDCIRVLGFASNYAQIFDAIQLMDRGKQGERFVDTFWGVYLPNPLPARGARVTVQGRYGKGFDKASSGSVTDDAMGILTFEEMVTIEPAPQLATLPGVSRATR